VLGGWTGRCSSSRPKDRGGRPSLVEPGTGKGEDYTRNVCTESVGWIDGAEFTLQAPIIKVTLADFIDEEKEARSA
jgi:hypothetical protein